MTVKGWLSRGRQLEKRLKLCNVRIETMNPLDVASYCDEKQELLTAMKIAEDEIFTAIQKLEEPRREQILTDIYIFGKPIERIAAEMYYTVKWVKILQRDAETRIAQLIGANLTEKE